jgi:tetratricopeptide (TPR) repeat protein
MPLYIVTMLLLWLGFVQPAWTDTDSGSTFVVGADPDLSAGSVALQGGRFEEGIRLTLKGLQRTISPRQRATAMSNLCAGYTMSGDYDAAIAQCNEALALGYNTWRIYNNRALAFMFKGELEAAQDDVDTGLSMNPDSKKLHQVQQMVNVRALTPRVIIRDE